MEAKQKNNGATVTSAQLYRIQYGLFDLALACQLPGTVPVASQGSGCGWRAVVVVKYSI